MEKTTIVIDDKIPFIRGVLEPYASVCYLPPREITREAVRDADILLIRTRTRCCADLLEGSRCRFIGTATIGYDHIDTEYCRSRGIEWVNAPGCNAVSVAQYILACLLRHTERSGVSLSGKCMGIVGVGHVGRQVETYCRRLGMQVLLNDPPRAEKEGAEPFVSLEKIARECDYISFHTPLTYTGPYPTYHLADFRFFERLQRQPVILNAARGGIVDEAALLEAYFAHKVSDMVIDCWETEPNPLPDLLRNAFIATPHIAGYSVEGKANATRTMLAAVAARLSIDPNRVTVSPPPPVHPAITVSELKKALPQAVLKVYDPANDTSVLKNAPDAFEQLRSHYPLRREFSAYSVAPAAVAQKLQVWGFAPVLDSVL
ncbi:MAG: 4-phosphoerythronate dehydrogenase PdxB [Porphyromonadaceae bacterium]|nr:4-phosphoerythronate dehydrogenase PdxB [Porphyromonadaceae bacterium]